MHAWADVATLINGNHHEGRLKAVARQGLPFLLRDGLEVAIVPPVLDVPRRGTIEELAIASKETHKATFRLSSIRTPAQARALEGCHLLAKRSDLSLPTTSQSGGDQSEHRLPWPLGWTIIDDAGTQIGTVHAVEEHPAQHLLVVQPSCALTPTMSREADDVRYIPYVEDFIVSIDAEKQRLVMALPCGLLSL